MWKYVPPDPADEDSKGIKLVAEYRNQFWFEVGPECVHKEPKPGRPIPPEDRR